MDKKDFEAFAREAAKGIKTEDDLNEFRRIMTKVSVETALNVELDDHLGYSKHEKAGADNSRNGHTRKTVRTEDGAIELDTPRDRNGSFEPKLVKKHQTRFTSMDDKILSLYAKGMSTRKIVAAFKETYDADVSPTLISKITDAVIERVVEWQSRPLDEVYPITRIILDRHTLVAYKTAMRNKKLTFAESTDLQDECLSHHLGENCRNREKGRSKRRAQHACWTGTLAGTNATFTGTC